MGSDLKNVLIFAHECAPYNRPESTIGAQRPAQFAKYLPEFGWRAVVICCDSLERRTATKADLETIAETSAQKFKRSDRDRSVVVPTPSLVWDGLLDSCWQKAVSGGWPQIVRKALTAAKLSVGDYSQSWQPCARAAARAISRDVSFDLCIGEHGPDAGLFLARWYSNEFGVKWVADFRDPILQPLSSFKRKLYTPIAKRLLATAAATINVNPVWSRQDHDLFGLPCRSIPNGFDPDEFVPLTGDDDKLTIAYLGSITASQRLEIFLAGLAKLRARVGDAGMQMVRFSYAGSAGNRVRELAERFDLSDVIEINNRVERQESIAIMNKADALLLLSGGGEDSSDMYFRSGYYPGKTFEYFGAGRPILCVPGDKAQLTELLNATRTGVILETDLEIAAYIADGIEKRRAGQKLYYNPKKEVVEKFTRRNLSKRLAEYLDSTAGLAPHKHTDRVGGEGLMQFGMGKIQLGNHRLDV
jgi:glycosyltransferase involved in cell wall biosynthesis